MQYKTIILELLQQHPEVHNQLRSKRMLLPALELCARHLKITHEGWKDCLSEVMPGRNQSQIASEALEIALKQLGDFLALTCPPDESDPLPIEEAMAFIRRRTPPV